VRLSIIIPVFNDEAVLLRLLEQLKPLPVCCEIIVADASPGADGQSHCNKRVTHYLSVEKGRARQMNAGAAKSTGDLLWFVHADTELDVETCFQAIRAALESGYQWGRFDVRLSGNHFLFRIIEKMINWRSCLTSVATGDQGIFVSRKLFDRAGGYPDLPLMEDVQLSKNLRQHSRAACLKQTLITSSRRWEEDGIIRTILLMWLLRFLYFIGVPARWIAGLYR
jgi:rSAM/selenodomain-associated transferase 2